jgi:tetratricopeptide (TPR) repeat protein
MQEKLEAICTSDERASRRSSLVKFVEQHQVPVSYKEARDVLVVCEEVRDFSANCELQLYSEVLRIRGDALAALSRGDEAISAFEDSLKFNGSNHQALRGLGYLAWHGHSHEDALSFFKRGLAVNPNDYQCLMGVGLVYRRLKMFSEAVFWLQKAIAVGGLESPSLSLLVQACLENSDSPEALAVLNEIRDVMGEHPNLDTAIHKLESHQ